HHVLARLHVGAIGDQQRGVALVHGVYQASSRRSTMESAAAAPAAASISAAMVPSCGIPLTTLPTKSCRSGSLNTTVPVDLVALATLMPSNLLIGTISSPSTFRSGSMVVAVMT